MAPEAAWWKRRLARIAGAGAIGLAMAAASSGAATAGTSSATGQSTVLSSSSGTPQDPVDVQRATATYQALQQALYEPKYRLYQCDSGTCTKTDRFGTLWPFTNAFSATNYLAATPGTGDNLTAAIAARNKGLTAYYNGDETNPAGQAQLPAYEALTLPPLGTGSSTFYDDNAWVALDEMYAYGLTGQAKELRTAEGLFRYVVSGWDTTTSGACPGGVFWEDVANSPRNTISNAPNAEVGLLIYQVTGNKYYLRWATKMYDWVRSCMLNSQGMYIDHINPDGTLNTALWSYNQGTMIGAGALLYQITGDGTYLAQAEQTGAASLTYYGTEGNLYHQPDVFDAIFFRNVFYLAEINHDTSYRDLAATYAQTAWTQYRQPNGLIDDPDPNGGEAPVNQTAPMAEIYALLAGSPPLMPAR